MSIFGRPPYKQIGTAADGTPIWELSNFFDSQYDSLPTTGWRYIPAQPGSDNASPEAWQNLATGAMASVNPASVSNPFYQVGTISAQGEGAVSSPGYVGNAPYEPYRNFLSQVFTGDASGMGKIQGDPNFNWQQYFDPLPVTSNPMSMFSGADFGKYLSQANAGIQKLVAARPDLTIRSGPWGSGFVPWSSMDDFNRRSDYFNPGEGFFEGMFDYAGEVVGDLWDTPLPAMAALAAGVGYANAGAAGGAAGAGGSAAAEGAGYLGLNPASGAVGLSPAAAGAGLQLTPEAVAAFDAGINIPGLAIGGAAAGAGLGSTLSGVGDLLGGLGDIWGGVKDFLPSMDTAAALAPILLAINYAKNQGPFDTSRLESTYNEFTPDALAFEYDQNTARGRNDLTSSLTQRGVMGSSFGNMDLTNFQTSRDLGRRSLINQGLAQRGNIAASLLDAQVKERQLKNQLYGTSLLALGNVFGGRNQPQVRA